LQEILIKRHDWKNVHSSVHLEFKLIGFVRKLSHTGLLSPKLGQSSSQVDDNASLWTPHFDAMSRLLHYLVHHPAGPQTPQNSASEIGEQKKFHFIRDHFVCVCVWVLKLDYSREQKAGRCIKCRLSEVLFFFGERAKKEPRWGIKLNCSIKCL
jgi:hypothetical protein